MSKEPKALTGLWQFAYEMTEKAAPNSRKPRAWVDDPEEVRAAIAQSTAAALVYQRGIEDGYKRALFAMRETRIQEAESVADCLALYPRVFRQALVDLLKEQLGEEDRPTAEKQDEATSEKETS